MPKGFRSCKHCGEIFEKRFPLQAFCCTQHAFADAFEKKRNKEPNGPVHPKSPRRGPAPTRIVQTDGPPDGERAVFERIWGTEPEQRRSFVTGHLLPDYHNAYPWYFSHILPKGKSRYPMFKYYQRNIVLKNFDEHTEWEHHQYRIKDNPQWAHVFQLQEDLKSEYEEHRQLYEAGKVEYYKT